MQRSTLAAILFIAALVALPLAVHNPYYIHLVETIMIYAIVLFGLDIVVGYTGQVSLGHAGLFGVGAYTAGVLVMKLAAPLWITLPAAIVVTAGFGALLALPALRVTGPYLAMVTLAFGTIIQILINEMTFLTEGPMGIKVNKPMLFGVQLGERGFYWVVLAMWRCRCWWCTASCARTWAARSRRCVAAGGVGLHGCQRLPLQGLCLRHQRRAGRLGRRVVLVFRAIHQPQHVQLRADGHFPAGHHHGRRKTRTGALLGATIVVLLPKLLDDLQLFREVAVAMAVLVAIGRWWPSQRGKTTWQKAAVPGGRHRGPWPLCPSCCRP